MAFPATVYRVSAIEELEAHGFAKAGSDAREVFSLTRKGFEVGDALNAT